jgi:hypothetical protein
MREILSSKKAFKTFESNKERREKDLKDHLKSKNVNNRRYTTITRNGTLTGRGEGVTYLVTVEISICL